MTTHAKDRITEFECSESMLGFEELHRTLSPCGRVVLLVGRRPDHTYTYALYFWDISDYDAIGSGYWAPGYEGGLFADLDSATQEGHRLLQSGIVQGKL